MNNQRWFKITGYAGGKMLAKVIRADSSTDAREKAELAAEMAGKVLATAGMESDPITCTIVEMVEVGSERTNCPEMYKALKAIQPLGEMYQVGEEWSEEFDAIDAVLDKMEGTDAPA